MSMIWVIEQTDRFNPKLNMPLETVTWGRDIRLAADVGMGITSTSFLRTSRNAQGSVNAQGFPWLGDRATIAPTANIDNERIINAVRNLSHTIEVQEFEAQRAMQAGEDIMTGKMMAMQKQYQFNTDKYVYLGSSEVNVEGLFNRTDVGVANAPTGDWPTASPDEIIYDITEILTDMNENAGYEVYANRILLPPARWNYIFSTPRASNSDTTILKFILDNNISAANGAKLEIFPCKWLINAGVEGSQRMVAYNLSEEYIRFPMMPLRPFKSIDTLYGWERSYVYRWGQLELVYPETILYRDGI